jgi:hypothetical protein
MTEYIRAAQAYPATSSVVANVASDTPIDLRNLRKRVSDKLGVQKGTTQPWVTKSIPVSGTKYAALIDDRVYAAMIAASVDVSDAVYNSATPEGTYTSVSLQPTSPQPGLHRQIVLQLGDSITASDISPTIWKEYTYARNKLWASTVACHSAGLEGVYVTSPTTNAPDYAYTKNSVHALSRMVFRFGVDSCRFANQAGWTYSLGFPWNDNMQQLAGIVLASTQQMVANILLGTNDVAYSLDVPNAGLYAVPTGTPGYTYAGSPNFIDNCVIPGLAALKAMYPSLKVVFMTPPCRGNGTPINARFVEIAQYIVANKVALGIDIVIDTRQIAALSPTVVANSANPVYYYEDGVHLTPYTTKTLVGPAFVAADDYLLGIPLPAQWAGIIIV